MRCSEDCSSAGAGVAGRRLVLAGHRPMHRAGTDESGHRVRRAGGPRSPTRAGCPARDARRLGRSPSRMAATASRLGRGVEGAFGRTGVAQCRQTLRGSIARCRRYRNVPRVLRNAGVGSGRASGHLARRAARGFRSARTPRADRRVCIDYPMEFSFADRRVEAGAGTRRRVREHPEAFGVHAAHCARACRLDRPDEIAARPRVSVERARSHGGRDAVSTSWCCEDFVYRQHRDRAAHRGHRRRAIQAPHRGRRRKVTDHRVRGYADRGCRRMDPVRGILQSRRGL